MLNCSDYMTESSGTMLSAQSELYRAVFTRLPDRKYPIFCGAMLQTVGTNFIWLCASPTIAAKVIQATSTWRSDHAQVEIYIFINFDSQSIPALLFNIEITISFTFVSITSYKHFNAFFNGP